MKNSNVFAKSCIIMGSVLFFMDGGISAKTPASNTQKIYVYDSDSLARKPRLRDEDKGISEWLMEERELFWKFVDLMKDAYSNSGIYEESVDFSFVVNTQGEIEDIRILKSPGEAYSRIIVEELKKCPQWIPGLDLQGNTVPVRIVDTVGAGIEIPEPDKF